MPRRRSPTWSGSGSNLPASWRAMGRPSTSSRTGWQPRSAGHWSRRGGRFYTVTTPFTPGQSAWSVGNPDLDRTRDWLSHQARWLLTAHVAAVEDQVDP